MESSLPILLNAILCQKSTLVKQLLASTNETNFIDVLPVTDKYNRQ